MKNIILAVGVLFLMVGCSHFKKSESGFKTESDFLNQGHVIEEYKEPEKVGVEKENIKSNEEVESSKKTQKIEEDKNTSSLDTKIKDEKTERPKESKTKEKKEVSEKNQEELPFIVGEEIVLSASFFGMEAGKVFIGVDKFKVLDGKKLYHFYAIGKSSSVFSLFYKVKNKIESLWDPVKKLPITTSFDAKESKQKYKARAYFDWKNKKASYFEEGWHKKKGDYKNSKNWDLKVEGLDIVSSIFFVRLLDLEVGSKHSFNVFEEDKVIQVTLEVDRKETIKTNEGRLETFVLKPSFKTKGKFKKVGDISLWVTADKFKRLVRVESKIKIGSVVASLDKMTIPKK